jgi:hypothetical protein
MALCDHPATRRCTEIPDGNLWQVTAVGQAVPLAQSQCNCRTVPVLVPVGFESCVTVLGWHDLHLL